MKTAHWSYRLGPAFVAAMAYVDPGNVAANSAAGASYGYLLLWALVLASLMAMLIQYLSAKLGVATEKPLAEHISDMIKGPRLGWLRILFGSQALLVAIATDLAEVVGGAIALNLLFGIPLWLGGMIVGLLSTLILNRLRRRGEVTFEIVLSGILAIIAVGFLSSLFFAPPSAAEMANGMIPRFSDAGSVQLVAAMLGATVMPHAIYLHSQLARLRHGDRTTAEIPRLLRIQRYDVVLALLVAGSVNVAMLLFAAAGLRGHKVDSIEATYHQMGALFGPVAAVIFGIGLLASGIGSSIVGTDAGASMIGPLVSTRLGLTTRRLLTVGPAVAILWLWPNPTQALVWSQLALSFGIAFALIPLAMLTGSKATMGRWANPRWLNAITWLVVALVLALNVAVLVSGA